MMFGFPMAFAFCGIMLVAAAVFFYKRRSREVIVPAVQNWLLLGKPVEAHSWKSLLRRLLTLLLQLLIIWLLVVALADVIFDRTSRRLVIVVDIGFTMQTRETSGTRLDLAKSRAAELASSIPTDGEVIVLAAGQATMLALPPNERKRADEAIAALAATDVASDIPGAVRSASAYVDPKSLTDVVVLSDFAGVNTADLKRAWHGAGRLKLVEIGTDRPGTAITAAWSEAEGPTRHFTARIEHRGMEGKTATARLLLDGKQVAQKEVSLSGRPRGDAPSTAPSTPDAILVTLDAPAQGGQRYEIAVDSADGLPIDDRVFGVVPRREGVVIVLVTRGNWALETALRADLAADVRTVPPELYKGPADANVVIADNVALASPDKGSAGFLFIHTVDPFGVASKSRDVQVPAVTHWSGDHPVMTDFDATLLKPRAAMWLDWRSAASASSGSGGATAPARPREIVTADTVPLITEFPALPKVGECRSIYWHFDPQESNLVRRPAFPLLLWNTVDYLSGARDDTGETQATGTSLKFRSPRQVAVRTPDGRQAKVRSVDGNFIVADTSRAGHYTVEGQPGYGVSVLSTRGVVGVGRQVGAASSEEGKSGSPGARSWAKLLRPATLLLLATLLAVIDWILFHTGVIRIG